MTDLDSSQREDDIPFNAPDNGRIPPNGGGTDPLAVVSLVTGICGVVLWLVPFLGFLSAVAGVVTGIINLYQRRPGQGLAIAGLVTGGVGVLGGLMFWGFVIVAVVGVASSGPDPMSSGNMALPIV